METYQILGQYTFYVDVQYDQELSEKSNITINSFAKRGSKLPIPSKYQWFRDKQQIDNQGNIYQCCALDIGSSIEVQVTSCEDEYDGKAIIQFQQIALSQQLENILLSLLLNAQRYSRINMQRTIVSAVDGKNIQRNFEFLPDQLTVGSTQIPVRFPNFSLHSSPQDVKSLKLKGQLLQNLNIQEQELSLKFQNRDERDIFMASITCIYSVKHIQCRTIIENIGQILQSTNHKEMFQWIIRHKVCQIPLQMQSEQFIKVNGQQDDYQSIKAQNSQLQMTITTLQNQLKRQNQSVSLVEPSERLQKTNPPFIAQQDRGMRSPSAQNSMENKYKKEIDILTRQVDSFKKNQIGAEQITQLQAKLDKLNRENSDLKKKFSESRLLGKSVNEKYVSDFQDNLNSSLSSEPLERMVQSLKQELKAQFLKEKKLQSRIQELELENTRCQSQLNLLNQSGLKQSMITVDEQQLRALEERIGEAKKFNGRLKDEIDRLKRKNGLLQEENDELKQNRQSNSGEQFKEKLLILEKENRALKERMMPSPQGANDKQLENLARVNEKLMSENSELQKKIRDLDDDVDLIKNLSQSRVGQGNQELESENQYLKKKIELLLRDQQKNPSERGSEDKDKNTDKVKVLEAQIQRLKEQSQRYMEENIKQFDEIRALKDKIDFQSMRGSRVKDSFLDDALQEENKQLQYQLNGLKSEINSIKKQQKINVSAQYSTAQHDDSVKLLKMELENEQLRMQIKEQSNRHNGSSKDKEEIQVLQFQVQRLQSTNQRVMEQNSLLLEQIKHLQEELCSKSLSQSRIDDSMSRILESPKNKYKAWGK